MRIDDSLARAFAAGRTAEVTFTATVTSAPRFFYGDRTRAVHEAFSVRPDGVDAALGSIEVVDNLKLAPRLPATPGDRVRIRGELVPDARRGPLVHWTHHDPRHHHPDGFIELDGVRYA